MASLKKSGRSVNEGSAAKYTATLKDPAGSAVTLSNLTTLEMVLYNQRTGAVINGRGSVSSGNYTFQNVKNLQNVTFHSSSGLLTWNMQPGDNVIVDTTLAPGESETHVAVFRFVYSDGSDNYTDYHTEVFEVEQVRVI